LVHPGEEEAMNFEAAVAAPSIPAEERIERRAAAPTAAAAAYTSFIPPGHPPVRDHRSYGDVAKMGPPPPGR